jgi:hypothetical protein
MGRALAQAARVEPKRSVEALAELVGTGPVRGGIWKMPLLRFHLA